MQIKFDVGLRPFIVKFTFKCLRNISWNSSSFFLEELSGPESYILGKKISKLNIGNIY